MDRNVHQKIENALDFFYYFKLLNFRVILKISVIISVIISLKECIQSNMLKLKSNGGSSRS